MGVSLAARQTPDFLRDGYLKRGRRETGDGSRALLDKSRRLIRTPSKQSTRTWKNARSVTDAITQVTCIDCLAKGVSISHSLLLPYLNLFYLYMPFHTGTCVKSILWYS